MRYWDWAESLLLLLITPLILLPNTFVPPTVHQLLVGGLFIFAAFQILSSRAKLTPLWLPLLLLISWLPVNIWVAIDSQQAWVSAGYFIIGITYYLVLTHLPITRREPRLILWLLLSVSIVLTLLGPRLVETQKGIIDLYAPLGLPAALHLSALGEAINPNVLAGALVLLLPFQFMFVINEAWAARRWHHLTVSALFAWTLLVIGSMESRGAYLASAIVIPLLLIVRWPRLVYTVPLLLIGGGSVIVWLGPQQFLEMLAFSASTPGLDQRLEIWQRAWYALGDFAFTGIGIGTFDIVIPLLYPYFLISPTDPIPHAHNLYLQIGLDLGLPGLIAHLALWITLFALLAPLLRQRDLRLPWTAAAGAFGALVAMLLHGLVDAVTWSNKLAFLPWWLYALITLLFLQHWQTAQAIAQQMRLSDSGKPRPSPDEVT